MPKMKSHSGAKKRFRITPTGSAMHQKAGRRHLLIGESSSRRRNVRNDNRLNDTQSKMIRALLPYAG